MPMHVEISGARYPISNDFDPDYGQEWAWDGAVPECPECADTLCLEDGSRLVEVDTDMRTCQRLFVVCACGYTADIHFTHTTATERQAQGVAA